MAAKTSFRQQAISFQPANKVAWVVWSSAEFDRCRIAQIGGQSPEALQETTSRIEEASGPHRCGRGGELTGGLLAAGLAQTLGATLTAGPVPTVGYLPKDPQEPADSDKDRRSGGGTAFGQQS